MSDDTAKLLAHARRVPQIGTGMVAYVLVHDLAAALEQADEERDELARLAFEANEGEKRLEIENQRLRDALVEARPYVFNVAVEHAANWRGQTALEVQARVDAALADGSDG